MPDPAAVPKLRRALADTDSAVRYWGAMGLLMRGRDAVETAAPELTVALDDVCPEVRIVAAQALAGHGGAEVTARALRLLADQAAWQRTGVFAAMAALNALENLGARPAALSAQIAAIPTNAPAPNARYKEYVPRLLERWRPAESPESLK